MKVKECKGCCFCQRRTWSHEYKPRNFHMIGMTHAYAYCTKHQKRVSEVKRCEKSEEQT
jgi:hypothetical protein